MGASRKLLIALLAVVLLMAGTVAATLWMARQQDLQARTTARRIVAGGLEQLQERARTSVLDYAFWTAAYEHVSADDLGWISDNIGSSTSTDTFGLAVTLAPGKPPIGWFKGEGPRTDLLSSDAISALRQMIDRLPIDSGEAPLHYARAGGSVWLLAIARILPQDGRPVGAKDAAVPRLVIGLSLDEALAGIGRRFGIDDLGLSPDQPAGDNWIALERPGGQPVAFVRWTPPMPGQAMLTATLLPLAGLMAAVAAIVLLVSREMVRTARSLEGALERARTADRSKTDFLGNVSHELRTPLNGVIGVAQLLQMRECDPEARTLLDILLESARSQLRLVNDLLDITRIESGALTLEAEPFEPAAVVADTVRLLAPEAESRQLALEASIDPGAQGARLGDALAFRQVVTNLVGNAVKFTETGAVRVSLGLDADGAIALVVEDSGVGIDPSQHERIFERFAQVDGGTAAGAGGAGLGLAITRALVELMGGTIRVASALGAGAVFTVTLSLAPAPASPIASAA